MPTTHTPETRAQVLAAVRETGGSNLTAIARAFGVAASTIRLWCRADKVPLMPPADRERLAGRMGTERQWGAWEKRRAKAKRMRAKGASLAEIQLACGYKSLSAAHYAVADLTSR